MKDLPIIFSASMIRALLEGRKTMTRRLALTSRSLMQESGPGCYRSRTKIMQSPWQRVTAGDRLWVRESVAYINNEQFGQPSYWEYRADTDGKCFAGDWPAECKDDPERPRWKPSIHMPRAASRLTLVVTASKVERLQDLSESDALREGVQELGGQFTGCYAVPGTAAMSGTTPQDCFERLWDSLHGAGAWAENPKVVAISFDVIKSNIDSVNAKVAA